MKIHEKFEPLWTRGLYRFKSMWGGRGGMKTRHCSSALIDMGAEEPLKIICAREFQTTMEDSVLAAMQGAIKSLGLDAHYTFVNNALNSYVGSKILFKGLERNRNNLKGWEDVDIVWIEEAQTLSAESWKILEPTIRKPGSEIWFTWNPDKRSDTPDKIFLGKEGPPPKTWILNVGWQHNPWFKDTPMEDARLECKRKDPDLYMRIWEGKHDDSNGGKAVLNYGDLLKCVDAHKKLVYAPTGYVHMGLDPADEGEDASGLAGRQESLLFHAEDWNEKYLKDTSARAHRRMLELKASKLYYDAGGLGAGVKSDLHSLKTSVRPDYISKPFLFGGAVNGKDKEYLKGVLNKDVFAMQNAQAWWNIRLRVQNTMRALDGQQVDLKKCFFIDRNIKRLDDLLSQLAQCVYERKRDKIYVDKQPTGTDSPNIADAVVMAYAWDIRKGLKA